MSEQNTLIKFGHKFQTKVISSLLGERVFLQTICDILEPEYFDSDSNKWIFKRSEIISLSTKFFQHLRL